MVLGLGTPATGASGLDFHALFESRCGGCHGHAGPFVSASLARRDNRLVSRRTGTDVRQFLAGHFGNPSEAERDLLLRGFALQVESGGLYRRKCYICHKDAKSLARLELILRDELLVGRYSGRSIAAFLEHHGRLAPDERAVIHRMLRWQLTGDDAR